MCLIWSDRVTEAMPDDMPEADARQLLAAERAKHAETAQDLQVERAAHDETAEKMVQLQQRLEVTLQELANLERFTKRQQQPNSADAPARPSTAAPPPQRSGLLRQVYTVTVGRKPSQAGFYVNNVADVELVVRNLAAETTASKAIGAGGGAHEPPL